MLDVLLQLDVTPVVALIQNADPSALDPWAGTGENCGVTPPVNEFGDMYGDAPSTLFPFNILALAIDAVNSLGASPQTPVLPSFIPEGDPIDLHMLDQVAAAFRLLMSAFGIIGAGFMTYKLVSRSKEGD